MKICILGAGSWGKALFALLQRNHHDSVIVSKADFIDIKQSLSRHPLYDFLQTSDLLLWAIPAQKTKKTARILKELIPAHIPILLCSKGFDCENAMRGEEWLLSDIMNLILSNPVAILSGPNMAAEVAEGLPTVAAIASSDIELAKKIQKEMASKSFLINTTDDYIGLQISGAMKNIIAIASGYILGKKIGHNAHAAMIVRGFHEIKTFGMAMGSREDTWTTIATLGDLLLTCFHHKSRNTRFGMSLAQGHTSTHILNNEQEIVEGAYTCQALDALASRYTIPMPLCHAVYNLVYHDRPLNIYDLLHGNDRNIIKP